MSYRYLARLSRTFSSCITSQAFPRPCSISFQTRFFSSEASAPPNHFQLLGLPPRFSIDESDLTARFRRLQAQWHPDKHGNSSQALDMSARVNVAYDTLRHPHRRAVHLLHLLDDKARSNEEGKGKGNDDFEFLTWMMSLREDIDYANEQNDLEAIDKLKRQVEQHKAQCEEDVTKAFDEENNLEMAQRYTSRLQYFASVKNALNSFDERHGVVT